MSSVLLSSPFATLFAPLGLLAQSEVVTQQAYDWPNTPWGWVALVGGFALLFVYVVWLYLKDTRDLSWFWRSFLLLLRVAVVVGLFLVAINPQERTRKRSFRQSRVAVLIDDSLSMRHPLNDFDPAASGDDAGLTRAQGVQQFLQNSQLLENLREDHEVSVYTFSEQLNGPVAVIPSKRQIEEMNRLPGREPVEGKLPDADFWQKTITPRGTETALGDALLQLIDEVKGEQLSGIVTISEGAFNSGRHPDEANELAKQENARLITIGVGSTKPPKILEIASVQAPTDVRFGDPFEVRVFLQSQGLEDERSRGLQANVKLLAKPEGEEAAEFTVAEEQRVSVQAEGTSEPIVFNLEPNFPAVLQYQVVVEPIGRIPGLADGTRLHEMTVNVNERNTGVLIIAGGPTRDYRFVRNMLDRNPDIDLDVWLQSIDVQNAENISQECDILYAKFPESFPRRPLADRLDGYAKMTDAERKREATEYDVVVMFDPNWDAEGFGLDPLTKLKNLEQLVRWISKSSGGVVVTAGDVYTPEIVRPSKQLRPTEVAGFDTLSDKQRETLRGFSIEDLYPVGLGAFRFNSFSDAGTAEAWPIALTAKGRAADFLQIGEDAQASTEDWQDFEGLYSSYPTSGEKAGSTVYAHYADFQQSTEFGLPIFLASHFYGAGRVYYIGSAEVWRFRKMSEDHFDRFWLKIIQEAGQGRRKMGSSQSIPIMERSFVLGQTVQVRARLQNPQGEPISEETASVSITQPNGNPLRSVEELRRNEGEGNTQSDEFSTEFRADSAGQYRVEIQNPTEAEPLVVRVQVDAPKLEDRNRQQRAKLLTDLVRETGGAYIPLADANRLELAIAQQRQSETDGTDDASDAEESSSPESDAETPDPQTSTDPQSSAARTATTSERGASQLLPNRSEEYWIDKQLVTLWDRSWLMYLLIGLLSVEWLTRKLLKLA